MEQEKRPYTWEWIKRNKIYIAIAIFAIVILFVDDNNLFVRIKHAREIRRLQTQIEFYKEQIRADEEILKSLENDSIIKEHLAREKYMMRSADEDIFIE